MTNVTRPERPSSVTGGNAEARVRYRAVMSKREGFVFALLVGTAIVLTWRYAAWWFHAERLPENYAGHSPWAVALANVLPFAALTLLEALRILQMAALWLFAAVMRSAVITPPPRGLRVAVLTTIVPSREPIEMLERTLRAMKQIRYEDGFDVWVLDEEDDPAVRALAAEIGVRHFSRHGILEYNQPSGPYRAKTKAGNHNAWRHEHAAEYDVVAQMDPDHIPTEDFLEKSLGFFRDPDVAYVIAPQVYYRNTDASWIARGADEQNFGFSAITQRGANFLGMPIFIGSNHLCRTTALDGIGGYASHIVEDHLTGMRLLAARNPATGEHWKGVYTEEIISLGEGPARWSSYLSQQLRWSYGLIDIVRHHSARLLPALRPREVLGFVLIQSFYPSVAAILLIGLGLTTAHLLFGVDALHASFDQWLSHWMPQLSISIAIWYWLQRFYLRPRDRGWGLRAGLVGLGAMLVYTQAMLASLLGRGLSYVITPKGEIDTREPLRLFRWHLASLAVSVAGLLWASTTSSGAPSIKFWAALNAVQMAVVIATGALIPGVLRTNPSWRWFRVFSIYAARVGLPLSLGAASFIVAAWLSSVAIPEDLGPAPVAAVPAATATPTPPVATQVPAPAATTTPTASPTPTPVQEPVVARFLEPGSDAVAFGAFDPDGELAVPTKVLHRFIGFDAGSVEEMQQAVASAASAGQVALITWEPRAETSQPADLLSPIAAGNLDTYLHEAAAALGETEQPVILRFAPEMDLADDGLHPWADRDPAEFIAAWQHVRAVFVEEGATNVRFAWTPGGYFVDGVFISDDWYPGDDSVDLVGFSAFAFWEWEEWDEERARTHAFRTPEELLLPRYEALAAHDKPVIIPELGIDLHPTRRDEEAAWLVELIDLVDGQLPELTALVYFNAPHNLDNYDIDWRLDANEQVQLAARLAASPRIEKPEDNAVETSAQP